jgi:hypothetical protein
MYIIPGFPRRTHSTDSFAVGSCVRNARIICRGKVVPPRALYVAHYKHVCAFMKVNTLFKKTHHHNRYSKCLPSTLKHASSLLKRLFDTSFSSLASIDVIVSRMLCFSSFNVWGLFEYILSLNFPTDKNHTDLSLGT